MNARKIHPAWFGFEPGAPPTVSDLCNSFYELQRRLDTTGSLLFASAEAADENLIGASELRCIGDQLRNLADEAGVLVKHLADTVRKPHAATGCAS